MTIEHVGRRYYLTGLPYASRHDAKSRGAKWDPSRRAWWTGKKDVAEAVAAGVGSAVQAERERERSEGVDTEAAVIRGRARYQGRTYYVLYHGPTRDGRTATKLCFRDGSRVFWANGDVEILAEYREAKSIASLRAYAERRKREQETGECECRCHGGPYCRCGQGFCTFHHDGCDHCGCES